MEHTIAGNGRAAASEGQSALQNDFSRLKLVLIWLAVGLPMLWGAMKALEDIGALPL